LSEFGHRSKSPNSKIPQQGNILNIISRNFNDIEVIFDNTDSIYINATQIAKHFNKLPKDWLKTKDTQAYLEAFSQKDNNPNGDLVVVRKGGNDKSLTGTWIHKKLIISFARWLDPYFAVWCDETIEEILSQKFSPQISVKEKLELEYFGVEKVIGILRVNEASKIGMVETIHKKFDLETSYLPKYSDEDHAVALSVLLKKFGVKMSAQKFNKLLISVGILEVKTRKSSKYRTEKDVDGQEVKIPILKEFKSLTEKGLEFGKNVISPKNQLETQPYYFENRFSELLKTLGI
jgi:hypothetical protein